MHISHGWGIFPNAQKTYSIYDPPPNKSSKKIYMVEQNILQAILLFVIKRASKQSASSS